MFARQCLIPTYMSIGINHFMPITALRLNASPSNSFNPFNRKASLWLMTIDFILTMILSYRFHPIDFVRSIWYNRFSLLVFNFHLLIFMSSSEPRFILSVQSESFSLIDDKWFHLNDDPILSISSDRFHPIDSEIIFQDHRDVICISVLSVIRIMLFGIRISGICLESRLEWINTPVIIQSNPVSQVIPSIGPKTYNALCQ